MKFSIISRPVVWPYFIRPRSGPSVWRWLFLGFWLLVFGPGCGGVFTSGGDRLNSQSPGNIDGGIQVGAGEIAVSAGEEYALWHESPVLHVVRLPTSEKFILETYWPDYLVFGTSGKRVYVTGSDGFSVDDPFQLIAWDLPTQSKLWQKDVEYDSLHLERRGHRRYPRLYLTEYQGREAIIIAERRKITIRDLADGASLYSSSPGEISFTDFLLLDRKFYLVAREVETPEEEFPLRTDIHVFDLDTDNWQSLSVPNCADKLVGVPGKNLAFLAPTVCPNVGRGRADPISIIELSGNTFVRNLPGFGPVSVTSDESAILGFVDLENFRADLLLPGDKEPAVGAGRFQLLRVDLPQMNLSYIPHGPVLPKYTTLADPGLVLVGDSVSPFRNPLWILDLTVGDYRWVGDYKIEMDQIAEFPDRGEVFTVNKYQGGGLFQIYLPGAMAIRVGMPFRVRGISALPARQELLITGKNRDETGALHRYDIRERRILNTWE